ncbi:MAG: ASCH domain-containing protein [Mollicutes bacterium]|nr:ASCH domain-containing protein [Mollicutes bacterium]
MKVISLLEPWASLVKDGIKKIETRSWATKYRGELYIHASQRKLTKKDGFTYNNQIKLLKNPNLKYGYIIAKCTLADCIYMTEEFIEKIKKNPKEYICGEYIVGRFAWILKDLEVLKNPIPAKGRLGIWEYRK